MMSKKKWILGLIVFVLYLLLGASFFYKIESEHEQELRDESRTQRIEILKLLKGHYEPPHLLEDFLDKLGTYCGKDLINVTDDHYDEPQKWDFYHAFFFSVTVVTTVGYGNLAPTKMESRMFMIAYALIGIPYNGILFATLGEYFTKTFTKLYNRWKTNNSSDKSKLRDLKRLSLVGQILLYLIPGLIIFIFVPAVAFMIFENWEYDLAVYYAFVTLTTIGFGDYVAGMNRYNHGFGVYFLVYQICILIWITFGLGYLVMVIGFLTRGLRSKKIKKVEKLVKQNIRDTREKIMNGFNKDISYLRRLMNELYMAKFKGTVTRQYFTDILPVYREECFIPPSTLKVGTSQSFPDLRVLCAEASPNTLRRRAMSECYNPRMARAQSDTDLNKIDRDATFAIANTLQPSELLAKVVDALSQTEETIDESEDDFEELGVQGFSDSDILRSEIYGSGWSLSGRSIGSSVEKPALAPKVPRVRAASDVKIPEKIRQDNSMNDWTWSGPAATKKIEELRARTKFSRPRMRTKSEDTNKSWLEKFRSSFRKKHTEIDKSEQERQEYLARTAGGRKSTFSIQEERYLNRTKTGRASVFSVPESRVLEETTVADLLRALTSLHSRVGSIPEVIPEPHRKLGIAGLPPKIPSTLDLFTPPNPRVRRGSMTPVSLTRRRFSLHPVHEGELPPPPPYSPNLSVLGQRKGSLLPMTSPPGPALVHKQISRLKEPEMFRRTRHDSLRDIRIDK